MLLSSGSSRHLSTRRPPVRRRWTGKTTQALYLRLVIRLRTVLTKDLL